MTEQADSASPVPEPLSASECRRELARVRRELARERRRVALLRREQQQLREYIGKVFATHEEQRFHFSRTLHDEAGQVLTALKLSLEMALEDLETLDLSKSQQGKKVELIRDQLDQARRFGEETTGHIQTVMQQLFPSALSDLGLNRAVEGLCQDFARKENLTVSYEYSGLARPEIPPQVKITLYRILEDILVEAALHRPENKIAVVLKAEPALLTLRVAEKGMAAEPSEAVLAGLRWRLQGNGGRVQAESAAGGKSDLVMQIPLEVG